MRIGLIAQLNGRPDGPSPAPTWQSVLDLALAAERTGFDSFVFEDALMYRSENATNGVWESGAVAAALAAATSTISIGQSVINVPYRAPALLAATAATLDEISNGRYILGLGAGNTDDYRAFGIEADHRFSRFAEAIEIIHQLLTTGHSSFDGTYYSTDDATLVLRGPSLNGPPITIAAGGPKMLELTARFGDAWNWWAYDERLDEIEARISPLNDALDRACEEIGRDPHTLKRTLDLYSVTPPGLAPPDTASDRPNVVAGNVAAITEFLAGLATFGFSEVRCDLTIDEPESVLAMAEVVESVHSLP